MAFLDFLFGRPEYLQKFQNFTPQQQGLQNQSIAGSMDLLKQILGNQFDFGPIEQQARQQFQTSTIPGLAERFTSLGSGAQRSSAFQNALGSAGAGLESNLAALKGQYGLGQRGQNINLLGSLLGLGMQPAFSESLVNRSPGIFESLGTAAAGGLGASAGQAGPLLLLLKMLSGDQQQTSSSPTTPQRLGGVGGTVSGGSRGTPGLPGSFTLGQGII